ncbi:PREDICTED: uncharacterized protein LOC108446175 isoform X3 [Corvus brachyrhynchos]|uniref:uncharacterized protein LOC108446175 isoform X3 n=1 Tax=Corvus brachyrhynchos TaxID=85066 RepID=UPI000816796B|nr:PREDICTED: uncharacterized protein LOC108446175 isoform X3 [Corvus brachyrhynchos]
MAVPMKAATSQAALPGVALAATAPAAAPHAGVVPASCQPPGRPSDAPLPDDASSVAMDTPASLRESVKALRRQQPVTRLARNRPRTFPECKILGYSGYLQDALALTCGTRSRTGNLQGNLQMMTRMQIIHRMIPLMMTKMSTISLVLLQAETEL